MRLRARNSIAAAAACVALFAGKLPAQTWSAGSGGAIYYNGGNVGIGTASPSALLHVFGASGNPKITVEGGSSALFPLVQLTDDRTGASN
ncbi:MAG TPA: hypothetical protein VH639_20090 [Bryobacteraceae bacterium]|jgi:hypothetical protein